MKVYKLILIVFLAVVAQPALTQQVSLPLTEEQVMDLVKFGMDSAELAKRVKERGIDFEPSDDYLEALRKAGAQDVVIQAIREVKPKPLTREQVGKLVAGGVPSERAAMLVKQHGIDFQPDEQYLETLRVAGADDTLLGAIRVASAAAIGKVIVATSPNAEVYLDGALQGRADRLGESEIKAGPGTHEVKVLLRGKKDFSQSVTLAHGQTTYVHALLEDVGPSPSEVIKGEGDPSVKQTPIGRTNDGKGGAITLRYPSCVVIGKINLSRGSWHSLKEKDLNEDGNARLWLNITPGCPSRQIKLNLEIEGQQYPVTGYPENDAVFFSGHTVQVQVDIPMAIWRSATEMELVLDQ